jgi:hypothetical protein
MHLLYQRNILIIAKKALVTDFKDKTRNFLYFKTQYLDF